MVIPAHGIIVNQPDTASMLIDNSYERLRIIESMTLEYGRGWHCLLSEQRTALDLASEAVNEFTLTNGDPILAKRKAIEAWLIHRHSLDVLAALNSLENLTVNILGAAVE